MSLIKHLKETACPTCGASICEEKVDALDIFTGVNRYSRTPQSVRLHSNGQQFEHRKFICGCEISWSPNFERMEFSRLCPNSTSALARQNQVSDLLHKVKVLIIAEIGKGYTSDPGWPGIFAECHDLEYAIRRIVRRVNGE